MKRSGQLICRGRVPGWLADRMTRLGTAIVENVVQHYGASTVPFQLADPFWFRASRFRQ